jgi:cell division transport system ATP-binding protein
VIEFFHVSKEYAADARALHDITFKIEKGEFVFLTGPSGAGKTTLLKLIFAAEKPTRGQILVMGRNVGQLPSRKIPELRRRIGVVFQDFRLIRNRSVAENVAFAMEVTGFPRKTIRKRVPALLRMVGLAHKLNTEAQKLSGGEQQRVAVARAVALDPTILLADEPTGNLDSERSAEIMELFHVIHARGTTVVLATHDPNLLERHHFRRVHLGSSGVQVEPG